jgi:succinoglycan biosynthesis transport protein ExoP
MNESSSPAQGRHAWGRQFFAQLQRYRDLLMRRWWVIVVCVALALGIGVAMNRNLPPQFNSLGQMIVSVKLNIQQGSLYTEELGNFLGTQAALMQGSEVLNRARDRVTSQNSEVTPKPVSVQVSILPKTTIYVLRATGENPAYTKAFLQACMEEYINLKKGMAEHTSDTTIAGLTDQMLRLEPKMSKIDDQLTAFLATNDVALLQEAASVGTYLTALYQQLAQAQSELELLRSMTLDENLLLQQDRAPMFAVPQPAAIGTQNNLLGNSGMENQSEFLAVNTVGTSYLSIRQQIRMLEADQQRFAEYLKPEHPKMTQMSRDLEKLGRMLKIYREQSLEQLDAKKSALALQITNLQNQIKQWGKQNVELSRKSAEYERIKAKGDRVQLLYDQLLATLETLDVNKDISPEAITIYQPASDAYPDATLPQKRLYVAGFMGLGVGMAILMLLARLDDRISSFVEAQDSFSEEFLGLIPREKGGGKKALLPLLQLDDTRHGFVEAYRNMRSSLLYMADIGTRPHTLLVTSSVPNDGKTVTTSNLAITLAMGGSRVLIVDADLRKGTLHNRFNVKADAGLSEVLAKGLDWHPLVKETFAANLWLLPRGATTLRSGDLFLGEPIKKFLRDTIKEYDYVLLDTVPVMAADDVTSLAPQVDGVIFVLRAQHTSARVAHASLNILQQRKARVLGLVLNAVRPSAGDYYYHHYKDYYKATPGD